MKATIPKVDGDDDLLVDDDSEDGGFNFDDDSDQGSDVPASEAEDLSGNDGPEADVEGGASDDGADSLAEGSDAEDLLDLDAEVPIGLIPFNGAVSEEEQEEGEEWGGVDVKSKKRSAKGDERIAKRRKLRSLPTFASAEDYAAIIDAEPEDNL
jgi:ribosome biogenesis protein MAK21